MEIKYQNVVLRDMRESDIEDEIRWNTTDTQWARWDAPWESEAELASFDPEEYRRKELEGLKRPRPDHRVGLEIDTAQGVHIGSVSTYCIDENFEWLPRCPKEERSRARWAVGIDISDSACWSRGWGTQALTAFVKYHLDAGYRDLYTQTWSGNERMLRLAKKLGFVECCRKRGIRQVRGKSYDGLTFRLDAAAFAAFRRSWEKSALCLHLPTVDEMWFRQVMEADPVTMAYNAGWDVSYFGYHPDTGCIDFPENQWAEEQARLVGHEPERFYAYVREKGAGAFVGEVNFHRIQGHGWYDMGVLLYAPFRGRGYGRAALELLLERAFVTCGADRMRNEFEASRDAGLAVHVAAGFRRVGIGEAVRFGRPIRLLELELTRERYFADRAGT